jgi:membrane protease YdiL (CAAX protease family)
MSYAAYKTIVEDARRKSALWRLTLGIVTTVLLTLVWVGLLILVATLFSSTDSQSTIEATVGGPADTPGRSIFLLIVVAGLGISTFLTAGLWHGRRRRGLMGRGATVLRHFAIAAVTTLTIAGLLTILQASVDDDAALVRNLDSMSWLVWLPFAVIAIALQTGAEEVFFRGYLQSQLAARFRSPIVWIVVPSVAFGFAHFAPGLPAANGWLYVGFAAFFGLLAADLTARTGSLGAAWGWHFANNSFAILVIATEGSVTGLGYWRSSSSLLEPIEISPLLLFDLFILLAVYFLLLPAANVARE